MSVMVDGSEDAPILIIGQSPGHTELAQDKPFVGGSGRLLWNIAREAGWGRESCRIINCIGETPEGAAGTPTKAQLEKYWDQFDDAVARSSCRVVVLLGGDALRRFSGLRGGIESWRGYLVRAEECLPLEHTRTVHTTYKTNTKTGKKVGDLRVIRQRVVQQCVLPPSLEWIIPTLHPAGVMRSGLVTLPAFAADLKRVGRALRGELKLGREQFDEFATISSGRSPIAFDIETSRVGDIERIAFAEDIHSYSISWDGHARAVSTAELSKPGRVAIAHNIAFDLPRLESAGVSIKGNLFDTMLAAAMLQPDLYKGLNSVASLYLDTQRWKHLNEDQPARYNALDAIRTLELYSVLSSDLARSGQRELFEQTIMAAVPTLIRMSGRGLRMDTARRDSWTQELKAKQGALLDEWYARSGDTNPASPLQLKRLIYSQWGMEEKYDKYGGVTTNESALRELLLESPEHSQQLQCLLDLRGVGKELETYADTPVSNDGCIHPSYLPATKDDDRRDPEGAAVGKGLAGTWRISARGPNIQNQPMEARKLYVPHRADGVLIECDYSQIEARIIAVLSGDQELTAAINSGHGLHAANAARLGIDSTRAKNGFYGWSYRAGAPTLHKTFRAKGYDIPLADCRALLQGFTQLYSKASRWLDGLALEAAKSYYVRNPFGLRRYFYSSRSAPAAANFVPQSTAAIIIWRILPQLERALEVVDGMVLTTVHDSVLFEVPRQHRQQAITIIKQTMEQAWPELHGLKVPVAVKVGSNWGEMVKVDD